MSNGRFNPNDPFTIGPEWPATLTRADPIDPSRELAQAVHMNATKTAAHLNFYSPGPEACGIECLFTNWILGSIYEAGQEQNYGSVRVATAAVDGGSTTGALGGGAVSVADALLSPADGKFITLDPGETIDCEFTLPFFLVTNPRILDVTFTTAADSLAGVGAIGHAFQIGASIFPLGTSRTPSGGGNTTYALSTGEVFLGAYDYIATPTELRRRGWQVGDITNLSTGTVHYRISNTSSVLQIFPNYLRMNVTYCQENRVGMGGIIRSGLNTNNRWVPGWQSGMDITNPSTGAVGVSLLAGHDYIVSLTQASNSTLTYGVPVTGAPAPVFIQSGDSRDLASLSPTEDSPISCLVYPRLDDGRIAGPGVEANRGFSMVLMDLASVSIGDLSQPYADVITIAGPGIFQDVISTTGGLYGSVRLTVRKVGNPPDLLIACGASTATLTVAQFDALELDSEGFATVSVPFNVPKTLVAGVEVVIGAVTLTTSDHWEIPILTTLDGAATYVDVTYGGAFQSAVFPGLDVPMLLQMAVPTVTGAAVTRGTMTLAPAVTGCPTPQGMFTSLEYASLCWGDIPLVSGAPPASGSPIVSGFCAWDVERRDADDLTWRQIAHVTDYNIRCVSDFEGRFGVSTDYRVRMCRLDGACGGWATVTGFARSSPTAQGQACDGLVFTSNEDPSSTLAYPLVFEGSAIEDFLFVEADTAIVQRLHMRDYQVVFRPLERGGVRFSRTMLVNAIASPRAGLLDEGFRELRDLAWASLSYVAVLDTRGNRWFAAVGLPAGTVRASKNIYLASVDVIEVTNRPSVIDVGVI